MPSFLHDVSSLRDFLADTLTDDSTVKVSVPKVLPPPPPPPDTLPLGADAPLDESASMKAKRLALQRKGAAAKIAAEEYARRFQSGDVLNTPGNVTGEEQGQANMRYCRICKCGENEGSEKAQKMLSCKSCGKKYHRNCVRSWGRNRDLFHWSSWTCPLCWICEVKQVAELRQKINSKELIHEELGRRMKNTCQTGVSQNQVIRFAETGSLILWLLCLLFREPASKGVEFEREILEAECSIINDKVTQLQEKALLQ